MRKEIGCPGVNHWQFRCVTCEYRAVRYTPISLLTDRANDGSRCIAVWSRAVDHVPHVTCGADDVSRALKDIGVVWTDDGGVTAAHGAVQLHVSVGSVFASVAVRRNYVGTHGN